MRRTQASGAANWLTRPCAETSWVGNNVSREGQVSVRDNGRGFDPDAYRPGTGLQDLTDRVEALNATLHITSGETGTTITTDIPAQPV